MKKPRVLFLSLVVCASFALTACEFLLEILAGGDHFYGFDFRTDSARRVNATRVAENEFVAIYLENGQSHRVSQADAQAMAYAFANRTVPAMLEWFCPSRLPGNNNQIAITIDGATFTYTDLLDLANDLTGRRAGGRRTTILLYDIRVSAAHEAAGVFVAGFFYPMDMLQRGAVQGTNLRANGRDMFHINTFLLTPQGGGQNPAQAANLTIAHELMHLMNFTQTLGMWLNAGATATTPLRLLDLWIDEGLASQAEHVYLNRGLAQGAPEANVASHVDRFIRDEAGTIAAGNNFFVWGNHDTGAIMDDYNTAYMFFRWLFLQARAAGGFDERSLFRDIVASEHENYRAVTDAARGIRPGWNRSAIPSDTDLWNTLLKTWIAANAYPSHSEFGYVGDAQLSGMAPVRRIPGTTAALYPGEGALSHIGAAPGVFTPGAGPSGPNIRYAGLSSTSFGSLSEGGSTVNGTTMLTFNRNVNHDMGAPETGFLTNVSPPPPADRRREGVRGAFAAARGGRVEPARRGKASGVARRFRFSA